MQFLESSSCIKQQEIWISDIFSSEIWFRIWCLQKEKLPRLKMDYANDEVKHVENNGHSVTFHLEGKESSKCCNKLNCECGRTFSVFCSITFNVIRVLLSCFRGPIRVSWIENRVPRIRENYHWVPRIGENRVPRIREIGSLLVHTGYLTFSLKIWYNHNNIDDNN